MTAVGLVQLNSTADVAANLATTERLVREAADAGAELVLLPEAFAIVAPAAARLAVAESLEGNGPILDRCRTLAAHCAVDLVLGGFPEACDAGHTWNTLVHLDASGDIRHRYRKIHLFDVQLPDGTVLSESESTRAGETLVLADLPCGPTGLSICYDMRFPALYTRLVDAGAEVLLAPSAFTATTGEAHWHLLLRTRAVECQSWMLAPAQVGDHGGGRRSYGHSLAVDPWGEVRRDLGDVVGFGIVEVDRETVARIRRELPSLAHRRPLPAADTQGAGS
ncbi:MAG: carbon-nitrogen hydrolase family protein [Pseudomonadales bacterium]|nr:carbon-nitrogen hydrolase family protein [Pseudomonadales bacterium]